MRHYADSSFLVSCYIADANTRLAKAYLSAANVPLSFNALQALEVQTHSSSASFVVYFLLRRCLRVGELAARSAEQAIDQNRDCLAASFASCSASQQSTLVCDWNP